MVKTDTLPVAAASGRKIPVPPLESPKPSNVLSQPGSAVKSAIPSPARVAQKTPLRKSVLTNDAASSSILSTPAALSKRLERSTPKTSTIARVGGSAFKPSPPPANDTSDDVRVERDNDSHRKQSVSGRRLLHGQEVLAPAKQQASPPVVLKSTTSGSLQAAGTASSKAASSTAQLQAKPVPRSISTLKDRMPGETRSSMLRRSCSVGKGRLATPAADATTAAPLAGAKARPILARPSSARPASAAGASRTEKRDTSTGRPRSAVPASRDVVGASSVRPALGTITEARSRPAVTSAAATATSSSALGQSVPKLGAPAIKPAFSLNLAALKQAQPEVVEQPSASTAPEEPPVPKLDLGGILQKRAEEQAAEPVFVVAASNDDTAVGGADKKDKKASGRQGSAKEEPAEHFYLYPKVDRTEKKKIDDMCRGLPKRQQTHVVELFEKMVEARQNCEQMCFRGHRLLDQAQAEYKNRLAKAEEEKEQWRNEAEFLRSQLAMLLATQQAQGADSANQQDGGGGSAPPGLDLAALLQTFDSLAILRPPSQEPSQEALHD